MKASKLRDYTDEELLQASVEAKKAVSDLRIKQGTGDSSEQPLKIREQRRDVARTLTVMRERSIK